MFRMKLELVHQLVHDIYIVIVQAENFKLLFCLEDT